MIDLSKPEKCGINLLHWQRHCWNVQIHTGKPSSGTCKKHQGMGVVLDMTKGLKGHNVTCDNFLTSYLLGVQLRKKNLTLVGTVKKNSPELPRELLLLQGREVNSSRFTFSEDCTIVSYMPKKNKNVLVLSTMHNDTRVSDGKGRKPDIILHYTNTKGGVNDLDKMTSTYSCQKMTHTTLTFFGQKHIQHGMQDGCISVDYSLRSLCYISSSAIRNDETPRTLPRIAAAKSTVERLRKEAEQPSTSASTDTDRSGKESARCQLSVLRDNKTSVRCQKCQKYICKHHIQSYCNLCAKEI
ncbi:PiggyBac transposable element-derived protein 4 [Trichinella zimbabwensis]|uniref:PiggyBac transposable element-derived protein 4 n=1 Tax=Trichinella zimbabwensis TaxID=268475 RepID=A0A0V1I607_9BILA|nr:PiggyBac transposable element-derived protein 4 [Trichinella zimbabwensis]